MSATTSDSASVPVMGEVLPQPDPHAPFLAEARHRDLCEWVSCSSTQLAMEEFVPALAERLNALGVPVTRLFATALNKHPEVYGRGVTWHRGRPLVAREVTHDYIAHVRAGDATRPTSPMAYVAATSRAFRRRLEVPAEQLEFDVLRELKDAGQTDYIAMPLQIGGATGAVCWSTETRGGFAAQDVTLLQGLMPWLTGRFLLEAERYALRSLLQVYLGQNAGSRVYRGAFHRGSGERIRAAIWFCDLRNFTSMSDGADPERVVRRLDRYFERVGGAVMARGGEILKFIGDAILAVFPVETRGASRACEDALNSARDALAAMDALNAETPTEAPLAIGVALHVGEVMYGNIGARNRLDFTVIGASVNEVCRLEGLCKPTGWPIIASHAFVSELPGTHGMVDLGEHELKGVSTPRRVYGVHGT